MVSSCDRSKLVVSLGWCVPSKDLSWSCVQQSGYFVEVFLAVDGQVGAFREELTYEAVPVLVGSSLPRRVRVTEKHRDTSCDRELGVVGEFSALVLRERLGEPVRELHDVLRDTLRDVFCSLVIDLDQHPGTGCALNKGRYSRLPGLPDDEVALPVPGHATVGNLWGSLRDHHHVGDLASGTRLASLRFAHSAPRTRTGLEFLA